MLQLNTDSEKVREVLEEFTRLHILVESFCNIYEKLEGKKVNRTTVILHTLREFNESPKFQSLILAQEAIAETQKPRKRVELRCPSCGSSEIRKDAKVEWSVDDQDWELFGVYDSGFCDSCGADKIYRFEEKLVEEDS